MLHTFGAYQIKYKSLNTQVTNSIWRRSVIRLRRYDIKYNKWLKRDWRLQTVHRTQRTHCVFICVYIGSYLFTLQKKKKKLRTACVCEMCLTWFCPHRLWEKEREKKNAVKINSEAQIQQTSLDSIECFLPDDFSRITCIERFYCTRHPMNRCIENRFSSILLLVISLTVLSTRVYSLHPHTHAHIRARRTHLSIAVRIHACRITYKIIIWLKVIPFSKFSNLA